MFFQLKYRIYAFSTENTINHTIINYMYSPTHLHSSPHNSSIYILIVQNLSSFTCIFQEKYTFLSCRFTICCTNCSRVEFRRQHHHLFHMCLCFTLCNYLYLNFPESQEENLALLQRSETIIFWLLKMLFRTNFTN